MRNDDLPSSPLRAAAVTLPDMSTSVPANAIHLRLQQPISLTAVHLAELTGELFEHDEAGWLGTAVDGGREGARRYLTDLTLPVRDHAPHMTFKKAAYVDVGPVRPLPDGAREVEISWRSSSLAPLFPVFAGHLTVTDREIRLEGYYAPPGGDIGVALDRAFLNIAARGTARWFLGRVTEAVAATSPEFEKHVERRAS